MDYCDVDVGELLAMIKSELDYDGIENNYSAISNALVVTSGKKTFLIRVEEVE